MRYFFDVHNGNELTRDEVGMELEGINSRPWPGRDRSGRIAPFFGTGVPSKNILSMRTWSWNHSTWRSRGAAQQTGRCKAGAVWAESG